MGDNYYEILGVETTASSNEIKQAYFSLARQYHPDSNHSDSAAELFLVLQKAYEVLRNPKKRKEYDLLSHQDELDPAILSVRQELSTSEIPVSQDPQLVYALMELETKLTVDSTNPISVHICFVLDCSTSMKGSRMEMVKDCLLKYTKNLSQQDMISIVAFNDFAEIVLTPTRLYDVEKIENKIHDLHTGGGTEIFKGVKAGIELLWEGNTSAKNRYLILLTDGHTYGDEDACLQLAGKARQQGITITTFGIGNDWNDKFLDQLANLTGGTSIFVYHAEDLYNYLQQLTGSLRTIFARNTSVDILCSNHVKLNYVFRIEPFVADLGKNSTICIGDLHTDRKTRLLFAFQVDDAINTGEVLRLASGYIKTELITGNRLKVRKGYKLSVKITNNLSSEVPPIDILNAISRITMYQMQEKARKEVKEGEIDQAVKRLENMATRLLVQGNQPLANVLMREASFINKERAYSSDGEKRIKYGTRALLQLPPPMKREE